MKAANERGAQRRPAAWQRAAPWLITLVCFAWLYTRLATAAGRADQSLPSYLGAVFGSVAWGRWLMLMVPYSTFYFLVDSTVLWRVVVWFNARVRLMDILPIRASTYIISIINEQIGKGVIAYYLHRRHGVPGLEVGSSMLFLMFCEFYYLLFWATLGVALGWDRLPEVFHIIPGVAVAALIFGAAWILFFRGSLHFAENLRERPLLSSFRAAGLRHYASVIALRSPALLAAVTVYTLALRLFGVDVQWLDMLGILPVIFFGAAIPGPMRSVAIVLWVTLFPDEAGPMAAFGLVQHNFFIFFNAAIGLLFLRRANQELYGSGP
jgi:hypothetical protein